MSTTTDARDYADAALNQGKAAIGQGRVAFEQASNAAAAALDAANKRVSGAVKFRPTLVAEPAYAALGAADLVAEAVTKRAEALPAEALTNLFKASETGRARLTQVQNDAVSRVVQLRAALDAGLSSAKELRSAELSAKAKGITEGYVTVARGVFDSLSARGQARVGELRKDPRLVKLLGDVSDAADSMQARVRPVVGAVEAQVRPVVDAVEAQVRPVVEAVEARVNPVVGQIVESVKSASPLRSAPVRKAPVRKPAAKKAPAKAATTPRKSPAKTATTARKAPAKATSATATTPAKATPAKATSATATASAKATPAAKTASAKTAAARKPAAKKAPAK
jgi:hypothetical protein